MDNIPCIPDYKGHCIQCLGELLVNANMPCWGRVRWELNPADGHKHLGQSSNIQRPAMTVDDMINSAASFDSGSVPTQMRTGRRGVCMCQCVCVCASLLKPSPDLAAGKQNCGHMLSSTWSRYLTRLAWAWKHVARHRWMHSVKKECKHTHTHTDLTRVLPVMLAAFHTKQSALASGCIHAHTASKISRKNSEQIAKLRTYTRIEWAMGLN